MDPPGVSYQQELPPLGYRGTAQKAARKKQAPGEVRAPPRCEELRAQKCCTSDEVDGFGTTHPRGEE